MMHHKPLVRSFLAIFLLSGLIFATAVRWHGVYAQQSTSTPEPTETTFKVTIQGNPSGSNLAKLRMQLQYRAIFATQAVKNALCGRMVYITEVKTNKQFLGVVPCNRGGVYILKTRPRELLNYYQFVNAKTGKGKTIKSKEFGDISTYITKFETYHPLDQCSSCGSLAGSAPISPPVFVFPTYPSMANDQNGATPIENTPAPAVGMDLPLISVPESSEQPVQTATATPLPLVTPSPTPTMTVVPIQASGKNSSLGGIVKPPAVQFLSGVLTYSLYALLLIPLIILAIIWKRLRLS